MRKWLFFIKVLNNVFKVNNIEKEQNVEMYVCSFCGTIYLDKHSYLTHYRVGVCNIPMNILPDKPLHIKDML